MAYFAASVALSPCYEAIHHKVLDSEEIIPYIEGQRCHLVGMGRVGGFNHLPVVALNKEQGFFFLPILWQQKGRRSGVGGWGDGEGGQEVAEGFPCTAVIHRLRGPPRGTAAKSH